MVLTIRHPAVAGAFYPAEEKTLIELLNHFFREVPPATEAPPPKALIVPHAGYAYSGQVAAHAYALLRAHPGRWKEVILIGPAHTARVSGLVTDPHDYWETPLGQVAIRHNGFPESATAHAREHCLEVQAPFLQYVLGDFRLLPLLAGDLDPEAYAGAIPELLTDDTLLVISSDLSHFRDDAAARRLDRRTIRAIETLDYDAMARHGDACGKLPILLALAIARREGWTCRLLAYANSGDVSGDRESVVGYAAFGMWG